MTPTDTIIALEKALEAGPTSAWLTHPRDDNKWQENAIFAQACSPLAIRTLLDAHASALRDVTKFHSALARLETAVDWHLGRSGFTQSAQLKGVEHGLIVRKELYAAHDAARSALDDNTKGAAPELADLGINGSRCGTHGTSGS